jgi:putative transposase
MPDHIHIFLKASPTIAPNIVPLKGYTYRILRREFAHLKSTIPTLWSRSYFVSTHGHVSSETITKYVEEQQLMVSTGGLRNSEFLLQQNKTGQDYRNL